MTGRRAAAPVLLAALLASCATSQERVRDDGPRRPHVLLIVADDLGTDLGAYGDPVAKTPNIDRLAAEGLTFTRARVTTALCSPSRSAIYTGLFPHTNGMLGFQTSFALHEDVETLPTMLEKAGYWRAAAGKIHVRPARSFRWSIPPRPLDKGESAGIAAELDAILETGLSSGRPVFVMLNPKDPHAPYPPATRLDPDIPSTTPEETRLEPHQFPIRPTRLRLAGYYRLVSRLDRTVGAVLDVLERRGIANETLVVFTSDHGKSFPWAKGTLYEPGLLVPLIARWPGRIPPGRTTPSLASGVDIVPTILEAGGVPARRDLPGRSLLAAAAGPREARGAGVVFATHTYNLGRAYYPSRAVIEPRYKYIRNLRSDRFYTAVPFDDELLDRVRRATSGPAFLLRRLMFRPPEELYDLENDPSELVNLAQTPGHAGVIERMRERLRVFMAETGDPALHLLDWNPGDADPLDLPGMPDERQRGRRFGIKLEQLLRATPEAD